MKSLDGRSMQEYANALFAEWGMSKRGQDNGVLVAVEDRAMRIEVGYVLEGILPDGLAAAVIRETFVPRFQENDYRSGILQGTSRVAEIVRRNEPPTAAQLAAFDAAASVRGPTWLLALLPATITGAGAFFGAASLRAKVVGEIFGGIVLTGFGVAISVLMYPDGHTPSVVTLAAALAVAGFVAGGRGCGGYCGAPGHRLRWAP